MHSLRRPAVNPQRADARVQAIDRSAQAVAAGAALVVLFSGLASEPYFSPKWPLPVAAALLGVGLIVGPLAQLVNRQAAHRSVATVVAVAALIVLFAGISAAQYYSPRWPLEVAAVLLGLGLVAAPLAQFAGGRAVAESVQSVAAVAGLLVLILARASNPFLAPMWAPWATVGLLGLGLVAGPLAQLAGRRVQPRSAQTVVAIVALVVLFWGLASEPYYSPRWPLTVAAVVLGGGLVAGLLAQLTRRPDERVLSARVAELSRTRRGALDVQASELRRIERDLHDGAQVRLVALSMKLGRAEERFRGRPGDDEVSAVLREAREDATAAIRDLRELARGIAPPVLTDRGLEAAVRSLADRSGMEVEVGASLGRRPAPAVETAAYFVVAESLTNAAKHASGTRVEVRLDERGGDLFVEVTDFGPGGADWSGGGLTGLRQRVEALDGGLSITSPVNVGTQVEAVLPCGWGTGDHG